MSRRKPSRGRPDAADARRVRPGHRALVEGDGGDRGQRGLRRRLGAAPRPVRPAAAVDPRRLTGRAESIQMPTTEDLAEVAQLVINVERKVEEVSRPVRGRRDAAHRDRGAARRGDGRRPRLDPRSPERHRGGARRSGGRDRLAGPVRAADARSRRRSTRSRDGRPNRWSPPARSRSRRHARGGPCRGALRRARRGEGARGEGRRGEGPCRGEGRLEGSRGKKAPATKVEGSEPEAATSPPARRRTRPADG